MNPDPWMLARANLRYFTVKFLGLEWPDHYTEWEKMIRENPRCLVQSPRGSWKSYFFSLAYPLWRVIRGRTEFLIVSESEGQSEKLLRQIKEKVESTEALAQLRPTTKELWGTQQIQFPNGSYGSVMGFGTSRRGTHPDLINDDIEGEQNKMSREDKDRIYFSVITGMETPGTQTITVGTPIEHLDILERLEKTEQGELYAKWKRPAEKEGANQFPKIWTDDWLKNRRSIMGSIAYSREMLLERIDPTTQPFKREYETLYDMLPERFSHTVTVCDPAYTEGDGDYTAIITVQFTHGNHAYVAERKRFRRDDPGVIVDELFKTIKSQEPDAVGIPRRKGEAVSYSFEERRTRENLWNFKYVALPETVSKIHKSRIGGLVPRWEARSIHIQRAMTDLLQEIYEFRLDDSHAHDDMLDALAHCFNEDLVRPNAGKRYAPLPETSQVGRSLYKVARAPQNDAGKAILAGLYR